MNNMENFGSTILNAYLTGRQMKIQQDEFSQRQQLARDTLNAQIKDHEDRLKQDAEQFKARQQFEQANYGLHKAAANMQLRKMAAEGLVPIIRPQSAVAPIGTPAMSQDVEGNMMPVVTPEEYSASQMAIQKPLLDAKREEVIAQENAKFANTSKIQTQKDEAAAKRAEQKAIVDKLIADSRNKTILDKANIDAKSRLAKAAAKGSTGSAMADRIENIAGQTQDMYNGISSVELFSKLNTNKEDRATIASNIRKQGGILPFQKDVQGFSGLKQVTGLVNRITEFSNALDAKADLDKAADVTPLIPTEAKAQLEAFITEIGTLAKQLGSDTGVISNEDIKRFIKFLPKLGPNWIALRDVNRKELNNALKELYGKVLQKFPEKQRQAILNTYELNGAQPSYDKTTAVQ